MSRSRMTGEHGGLTRKARREWLQGEGVCVNCEARLIAPWSLWRCAGCLEAQSSRLASGRGSWEPRTTSQRWAAETKRRLMTRKVAEGVAQEVARLRAKGDMIAADKVEKVYYYRCNPASWPGLEPRNYSPGED